MSKQRSRKDAERTSLRIGKNTGPGYQVGYGRPPHHTRFKPGESGNPKGRPRRVKARNIKKSIQEVYLRDLTARDGLKVRRVPGIVLLHQKLLNDGLQGNQRAALASNKLAADCG